MNTEMHIIEEGSGRPLLLLHGWSCHGGFFGPQVAAFRDTCRVIVPDLPGHGKTGADGPELSIEAAADAVAELLAERDLTNVVCVGWSMGAHVAYSLIERHGAGRLSGLVVEDMAPKVLNDAEWHLGLSDELDARRNIGVLKSIESHWSEIAPRIAERIFAPGMSGDIVAYTGREIAAANPKLLAPMWASLTAQDFRAVIAGIDIPVVLAHGAKSALYGSDVARWQADRMPDGRVATFEASGHAPHLEEPAAFNSILGELLR